MHFYIGSDSNKVEIELGLFNDQTNEPKLKPKLELEPEPEPKLKPELRFGGPS